MRKTKLSQKHEVVPQSKPKTPTLTREQEAIAFQLIAKGGPDGEQAREMFVYFNQPLIGWVARSYRDKGLSWEELLSAGNMGLMKAITKFEPHRGLKFITCAVPWIKGEITAAFDDARRHKDSDRRIRSNENGVPLVDSVLEDEDDEADVVNGAELQEDLNPSEDVEDAEALHPELHHEPTLEEHTDLQEIANEVAVEIASATEDARDGGEDVSEIVEKLSPTRARSEGLGSSAGCAEWDNFRDDNPLLDASADPSPRAGGVAINFAADQRLGAMGIDSDFIPALEEAVERLGDPRQALILRMHLGLGGHERHTFKQIGDALDISLQRADAIFKATFAQLREDPTLELLFELTS